VRFGERLTMMNTVLTAALVAFVYVNVIHLLALLKRDNSIMDAAWGPGFVVLAWVTLLRAGALAPRHVLLAALVSVWGLRLCVHILRRGAGRGEDRRYRRWRDTWGRWFYLRSYLQIYLLQGALMLVVATPVLLVNARPGGPLGWLDALGVVVWLLGFGFEVVGDQQLLRFRSDPANKGQLMRTGLWRYTRHPNYFGEATLWWGIFLLALRVPGGYWALCSPLVITWLLLCVSGIPMLEAAYRGRPDFEEYRQCTSAFLPWFPRAPGCLDAGCRHPAVRDLLLGRGRRG
jgi:steroid 5-alpha reductase family enzyme